MTRRLILGVAVTLFFGCATSGPQDRTIGPQGYCERGLYIPTHVVECVVFCSDHGKVSTISSSGEPEGIRICRCIDGSVTLISPDPQAHARRLQCHE